MRRRSGSARLGPLRQLAKGRIAAKGLPALDQLTRAEVRALVYDLELHKVELEIQNEQLAETQLTVEESKERYRRLYESAPIGYLTVDPRGQVLEANRTASTLLSVQRSRFVGRKLSSFVAPADQDRWHLERRALVLGADKRSFELELVRADGTALHAQFVGSGTPEGDGVPRMLQFALVDVTELRSTERALRAATAAASAAEQRERRALAADLHDDAGQLLALASLKLRALRDELDGRCAAPVHELEGILAETRRRISSLSFQLSPPLLYDVGLLAAAEWLAEEKGRLFGLLVHVAKGKELELDEVTRVTLFRALRELLINVAKHAHVREAYVRIWRDAGVARVEVDDAGVGFDPAAGQKGFGLLALRDRVQQMGGRIEIRSAPGTGTRVVVSLPCTVRDGDEGGSGDASRTAGR